MYPSRDGFHQGRYRYDGVCRIDGGGKRFWIKARKLEMFSEQEGWGVGGGGWGGFYLEKGYIIHI